MANIPTNIMAEAAAEFVASGRAEHFARLKAVSPMFASSHSDYLSSMYSEGASRRSCEGRSPILCTIIISHIGIEVNRQNVQTFSAKFV